MAYGFKYTVTVDNTKVSGSSNLSNFPMLFSGTYDGTGGEPDLRTTGNGGDIENTDSSGGADGATTVPADFEFSSDEAGTTPLDFEVENYNASTGEIQAWVEIPTLSHDTDTDIYLHYGDSGVTTSQEDVAGTWNTNFQAVWHLNQSSGTRHDSTGNGNDLTDNNTVTGGTGQIDGASDFEGDNSEYLNTTDVSQTGLDITGALTVSAWFKPESSFTDFNMIAGKWDENGSHRAYFPGVNSSDLKLRFFISTDGSNSNLGDLTSTTTLSAGTIYRVDYTYNPSTKMEIFIDGTSDADTTTSIPAQMVDTDADFAIGAGFGNTSNAKYFIDGLVDEVRILNTVLSGDWIATEYNNQNSPSTFYTISEVAAAEGTPFDLTSRYW